MQGERCRWEVVASSVLTAHLELPESLGRDQAAHGPAVPYGADRDESDASCAAAALLRRRAPLSLLQQATGSGRSEAAAKKAPAARQSVIGEKAGCRAPARAALGRVCFPSPQPQRPAVPSRAHPQRRRRPAPHRRSAPPSGTPPAPRVRAPPRLLQLRESRAARLCCCCCCPPRLLLRSPRRSARRRCGGYGCPCGGRPRRPTGGARYR